jgi:hypothetical protein
VYLTGFKMIFVKLMFVLAMIVGLVDAGYGKGDPIFRRARLVKRGGNEDDCGEGHFGGDVSCISICL